MIWLLLMLWLMLRGWILFLGPIECGWLLMAMTRSWGFAGCRMM